MAGEEGSSEKGADSVEKSETKESDLLQNEGTAGKRDSMETKERMTPWEQHSSVISIPRFDYDAPSEIPYHSHSGFLITCTIKREKSATKEAIPILEKHINMARGTNGLKISSPDTNIDQKRRKLLNFCEDSTTEDLSSLQTKESGGSFCVSIVGDSASSSSVDVFPLSLVKLNRSGLLLFTIRKSVCIQNIDILTNIFQSLERGDQKPPIWFHRILPFRATCLLREEDLAKNVSRLVDQYVSSKKYTLEKPLKFAVGFNRRGIEETDVKQKASTGINHESILLERNDCISIVAGAVKAVVSDSIVDLKSPQMVVLVEVLPISGIPNGSVVVAVAVLPGTLVNAKPKLCVKPLAADPKDKRGGGILEIENVPSCILTNKNQDFLEKVMGPCRFFFHVQRYAFFVLGTSLSWMIMRQMILLKKGVYKSSKPLCFPHVELGTRLEKI